MESARPSDLIHRFWTGPARAGHEWTGRVLAAVHFRQVQDWTVEALPGGIRRLIDDRRDPRDISNLVRYALLHRYGGLWVDNDVVALESLTESPTPWTAALRRREGCALWFPHPGHPMMAELVQRASQAPAGPSHVRSGADLLHEVGRSYPDVRLEHRVLPYSASGSSMRIRHPMAVHLWETSPGTKAENRQVAHSGHRPRVGHA